jgi:hypothetical protein
MLTLPERRDFRSSLGIVFLVLAVVLFIAARTHADPDLWGHVRFGQDLLTSGIPETDVYSYLTEGYPWINHELLAEILFAALFNVFGVAGLVGLKAGVALCTAALLYRRFLRVKMHALRAGILILIVVMLMSVGLWTIRPHLFTYLFFLLTLLLLDAAENGKQAAFVALPAVMLVWSNTHGGFLAGFAIVEIWSFAHAVCRVCGRIGPLSPRTIALVLLPASCAAATLVNPYGVHLISFLLRTATVARPEISEWQSISLVSPQGAAYIAALGLALVGFLFSRRPRSIALLAVFVSTSALPLSALRHLPLFALAFAVIAGEHIGDVWNHWLPARNNERGFPAIVGFAGALVFFIAALPHFFSIPIDPSFVSFPARATAVMRTAGVQGNVATFFDWGEYIIWHLGPRVRVSVDGRRETVYSPESYTRSMRFPFGIGAWDELIDDSRTEMVLIGRGQPAYKLMPSKPDWLLVYEDSTSALYARRNSSQADALRNIVPSGLPTDGNGLSFP